MTPMGVKGNRIKHKTSLSEGLLEAQQCSKMKLTTHLKVLIFTLGGYVGIVCLRGKMIFELFDLLPVLLQLHFKLFN